MKATARPTPLNALIGEARLNSEKPNSAPSVASVMLGPEFMRKIEADRSVRIQLIAAGLNAEIRRYLHHNPDFESGPSADQIEMWSDSERDLVAGINRERVFVPSLGEFARLVPAEITRAQTKEAGEYLIAKGLETIRAGKALVQLAKRMK